MSKTCNVCKLEKPYGAFYRAPYGKGKVQGRCKLCSSAMAKKEWVENPQKRKARFKAWYKANRERNTAKRLRWRKENAERDLAAIKAWKKANPEKVRATDRRKQIRHRDRIAKYMKVYGAKWSKENRDKKFAAYCRYHARKRGATISDLTPGQWTMLKEMFFFACAYCGERNRPLTQDHVIPLSQGGNHTMENVVPACKSCNSSKNARSYEDFMRELDRRTA